VTSRSPRTIAGALLYDAPRFETHLRGRWERIRNRRETITLEPGGRGVRCEWRWSSTLHYCNVFPAAAERLRRRAFGEWPIVREDEPVTRGEPVVSFVIGHRGTERLPLLLETLRSIAGQAEVPIECIVVEQTAAPVARAALPAWVRWVHQPIERDDLPYSRSATFNEGVRHARGRVLVLHDNDMLVPAAYAREIARRVDAGFDAIDLKRFIFYLDERGARCEKVVQNLRGGSVAITREAYLGIGGFDEEFVGWGAEDNDFWDRAETRRTSTFGYLPIVHLWHAAQPEKGDRNAPAVVRYQELERIPAAERIRRLTQSSGNATAPRA